MEMRLAGYVTAGVFAIGLFFLIITQMSGAFVSDCPFQSPLSDMVKWSTDTLLPSSQKRRTLVLCAACPIILAGTLLITIYTWIPEFLLGFFFAAGCLLAVQKNGPKIGDKHYALVKDPGLTLFSSGIIFPLIYCAYIKAWCNGKYGSPWIMFYLLSSLVMVAHFIVTRRLAKPMPDNTQAEAIAWLLKSPSGIRNPLVLENACKVACEVAREDEQKAFLLSATLPLLQLLLSSALENQGSDKGIQSYMDCLAHLSSFEEKEQSFLRNQASMTRPQLSDDILRALGRLANDQSQNELLRNVATLLLDLYERKRDDSASPTAPKPNPIPKSILNFVAQCRGKNRRIEDEESAGGSV